MNFYRKMNLIFALIAIFLAVLATGQSEAIFQYELEFERGHRLVEKDIVEKISHNFRHTVMSSAKLWPGGIVHYDHSEMSYPAIKILHRVFELIEKRTCVRFLRRNKEKDFILYTEGNGCWSYVGRVGGKQKLSLSKACHTEHTVCHETMHALGFYHEHNRFDRDEYIDIRFENVKPNELKQFEKRTSESGRVFRTFDFNSTMLYKPTEFSRNKLPTMVSKIEGKEVLPDNMKPVLSDGDVDSINQLYQCKM